MPCVFALQQAGYGYEQNYHDIQPLVKNGLGDPTDLDATTLLPLIHRAATLCHKVRTRIITTPARDLQLELELWRPTDPPPLSPLVSYSHKCDARQTAEAYRLATLLCLHQAFPTLPSESTPVLADRIHIVLDHVPTTSAYVVVQLYP